MLSGYAPITKLCQRIGEKCNTACNVLSDLIYLKWFFATVNTYDVHSNGCFIVLFKRLGQMFNERER